MSNMTWQLPSNGLLQLQEIIHRIVVAHLWKISVFETELKLRSVWHIFEGDVKEKIVNLNLPLLIKNRMTIWVKPIGADILNWQVFHENTLFKEFEVFNIHSLQHLQRTRTGLIDYRRTAEEIISHEIFDVTKCFELACLYCLEDKILLLWSQLSEEAKDNFFRSASSSTDVVRKYWVYILRGDDSFLDQLLSRVSRPSNLYQVAFEISARRGNKSATEYFFHKLREDQRASSILTAFFLIIQERFGIITRPSLFFSAEKVSDVLCYLLFIMTSEQRMQVLNNYHPELLLGLLHWQFESNFFDIADVCWNLLLEEEYENFLGNMRVFINKMGYYIPKMFQNFFISSPRNFRNRFVEREFESDYNSSIFSEFLRAEDIETVKIIFRNIDKVHRESLVFSVPVCIYLCTFILSDKWSFVVTCIREAWLSEEDLQYLEGGLRYIARSFSRGIPTEWSKQMINEFFNSIN